MLITPKGVNFDIITHGALLGFSFTLPGSRLKGGKVVDVMPQSICSARFRVTHSIGNWVV